MRLKEFRKSRGMTQDEIANVLGIPTKTYQNYEREVREPDSEILCKLADYYHVSIDELMGRKNYVSAAEIELVRLFHRMNSVGKARLLELADDMVRSGKYEKKEGENRPIPDLEDAAVA